MSGSIVIADEIVFLVEDIPEVEDVYHFTSNGVPICGNGLGIGGVCTRSEAEMKGAVLCKECEEIRLVKRLVE